MLVKLNLTSVLAKVSQPLFMLLSKVLEII